MEIANEYEFRRGICQLLKKNAHEDDDDGANAKDIENLVSLGLSMSITTTGSVCIFEIPDIPRVQNQKAYVPIAFSIGPRHHDSPKLSANDKLKTLYTRDLISKDRNTKATLTELSKTNLYSSTEFGQKVQECYPQHFHLEFYIRPYLFFDGCFIIEFLHKFQDQNPRDPDDPVFSYMLQFLYHDLILLQNQIPWFVLEDIFDRTGGINDKPLLWHVSALLKRIFPIAFVPAKGNLPSQQPKHILDLLRIWLVSPIEEERRQNTVVRRDDVLANGGWKPIPPATFLRKAGVKLRRKSKADSILQVTFRNGYLEIPPLEFRQGTEAIFRNLICLEQCLSNCPHGITSYVALMGCLINSTMDFDLLCEAGIFDNWKNPEDVSNFFNKAIYPGAYVKDYYYLELSKQVNEYCHRRCPRFLANFRNEFTPPWAIISVIVAGFLFIFTLLQTDCHNE
ncbi:hypothetical protein P3X46_035012 [Hevea brasiliensis]|uniref:Uncharacterized protein n=1 Tax=Hevea brasiliensis TaxID=3981 RepID=A0ABQ9KBJ7_HEVBR|nr:UPF0481 protein At3g47200-like [Hevea brasiliensis]XP_057998640.1 UPF0481 protein At3g47200-like [Hevea brasiliensis]XP_057998641.1 UPF0481 protein At3g47200-like [Hevea brasiliensis]KAJ9130089.1 hypothetical protein P3X46_035012 [Hevea brasiliensis]